jgi:hypothetical protein
MNTIRMFAFVAAVLLTAFFFRVISNGLTNDEPVPNAIAAHATPAPAGSADRSSP